MDSKMKEVTAEANGRVNLIGEHTDYNDGWVLPTAIPQKTIVHLKTRNDDRVFATTAQWENPEHKQWTYHLGQERKSDSWIDYLQGVTQVLRNENQRIFGFEVHIESSVPIGSGLSSSAALEVSFLKALRSAFDLRFDDRQLARIGQRAENEFVGAHVGIMDQMACGLAKSGEALFLDTRTLNFEQIKLPSGQLELVVINSGLAHQNTDGGYNQRRAECQKACQLLGIQSLRDFGIQDLQKLDALPDVLKRRARHVITENQRVFDAVKALQDHDFKKLGDLFYQSHASMRDDYQVSIPAIDLLVKLASEDPAVYGARLTGGGFGGSIVAITKSGRAHEVANSIRHSYNEQTPYQATILVP